MYSITLKTAESLTGLSRRTLWRRISDGRLSTLGVRVPGEKTLVPLAEVFPLACIPLEADAVARIVAADAGHAPEQCDLGLTFLSGYRPTEAVAWFTQAAKQNYPDAWYWLGRCYLLGEGVPADTNTALSWLSQAADQGHQLAQAELRFLRSTAGQTLCAPAAVAALKTALTIITTRRILSAAKH